MYLWHIVYNQQHWAQYPHPVVNCFQNVSLAYRLQFRATYKSETYCCELLSKCIFGISFTMIVFQNVRWLLLWIAFKMYLWHIVYNFVPVQRPKFLVVNCFQNVSLAYRLQSQMYYCSALFSCELLSKCIFGISFTIYSQLNIRRVTLWIAFKMYLWHIVYNLQLSLPQ